MCEKLRGVFVWPEAHDLAGRVVVRPLPPRPVRCSAGKCEGRRKVGALAPEGRLFAVVVEVVPLGVVPHSPSCSERGDGCLNSREK